MTQLLHKIFDLKSFFIDAVISVMVGFYSYTNVHLKSMLGLLLIESDPQVIDQVLEQTTGTNQYDFIHITLFTLLAFFIASGIWIRVENALKYRGERTISKSDIDRIKAENELLKKKLQEKTSESPSK